ncbi:MAG TPA: hypothetical protein VGM81_18975 [Burkholderiaceae bacterium]
MSRLLGLAPLALLAAGLAAQAEPQPRACPAGVPESVRCLGGQDSAGAFYLIAVPKDWQGVLVLHAHGGPELGAPLMKRVEEDLQRWSIVPRAGYAWAASSYAQGGVAVHAAAEDTERLRQIAIKALGQPRLTILHGQSWGASVAAIGAETYTAGKPYDAVLLTSGVLAGGSRAYEFRLDLRVVYQYLCHNHPRPDEPQYPLWQGLPAGSPLTAADLRQRANECVGLDKPAAERSPEQARKLKTLLAVVHIPERSVQGHLSWATFLFRDIATKRTGGANVFGNLDAHYRGSDDDAALNADVLRYAADPAAVARFAADADPNGRIPVPVLSAHAIDDPTAFVEMENTFAQTMARAGHADSLLQVFSDDHEHSYLSDATYVALLDALVGWVREGHKPSPAGIAQACAKAQLRFPSSCHIEPDYKPAPLESRVTSR